MGFLTFRLQYPGCSYSFNILDIDELTITTPSFTQNISVFIRHIQNESQVGFSKFFKKFSPKTNLFSSSSINFFSKEASLVVLLGKFSENYSFGIFPLFVHSDFRFACMTLFFAFQIIQSLLTSHILPGNFPAATAIRVHFWRKHLILKFSLEPLCSISSSLFGSGDQSLLQKKEDRSVSLSTRLVD